MPELTSLGSVIKETYESEPDTNAFTDAEKSKLAAINPEDIGAVKSVNSKTGEVVLTAADVGALPDTYTPPAPPVDSVNGKTGVVTLTHEDVGALPDSYTPPAAPVSTVNGQTGEVVLTAADVGALPDSYTPPAAPVQSVAGKTGAVALEVGDVTGLQGILDDLEQRLAAIEGDQ